MTANQWFEENIRRVLKGRAARAASLALPAEALADTLALCLGALRPRNRWPENTRLYVAVRARLAEDPVRALAGLGVATAVIVYLGFGQESLAWLGSLLRGPG
jgi:hypothetical protein